MFNLEESISEWRQRMLADGINSPEPLGELESHLREEIERQMKSGYSDWDAFDQAIRDVGPPAILGKEFATARGLVAWFGGDKTTRINHILGAIWTGLLLSHSIGLLWLAGRSSYSILYVSKTHQWLVPEVIIPALLAAVDLAGLFGAICLFRGLADGRFIIRTFVIVNVVFVVSAICMHLFSGSHGVHPEMLSFKWLRPIATLLFDGITVWLLWSPKKVKAGYV